ncbi:ribonuclease HII [Thalassobacillus sp. C254]|uniref:ribonuclease HII n=1 Tax=Thalassobacillus sp. C254 TaxID=1225341 RepID=UPI0006D2AFF7|nr:ribonuclease HII [Thalassobacillus sp. C254]
MKRLSIAQIKEELFQERAPSAEFLDQLAEDERKGVQQVVKRYEQKRKKEQQMLEEYERMNKYEEKLIKEGYQAVAGIDEVGRGPLAGPVTAAAVILGHQEEKLLGLTDSKILSEAKREYYYEKIMDQAEAVGVVHIPADKIDKVNIYQATKIAMVEAVQKLSIKADHLLIDAMNLPLPVPQTSIVKGDANSLSIAAASVIAKVTRDRLMQDIHQEYPQYGFSRNAGYGTREHIEAMRTYGITRYHRKSFSPVPSFAKDE